VNAEAPAFLSAFAPDAEGLQRRIAAHVDDGMLAAIAAADYGFGTEANLVRLDALRDSGEMPDFNAQEVLALTRWAEPDWENWSGPKGARGHWMRAFACAGLLRAREDEGKWGALNDTLGQMLASLDALNAGLEREAAAFLAWRMGQFDCADDGAFFGIGLLWCALRGGVADDRTLVALCEWTVAQEECKPALGDAEAPRWLLSKAYGQRLQTWEIIGAELARMDLSSHSPQARDWIRLIGTSLSS
jgi:hypothetical protein